MLCHIFVYVEQSYVFLRVAKWLIIVYGKNSGYVNSTNDLSRLTHETYIVRKLEYSKIVIFCKPKKLVAFIIIL